MTQIPVILPLTPSEYQIAQAAADQSGRDTTTWCLDAVRGAVMVTHRLGGQIAHFGPDQHIPHRKCPVAECEHDPYISANGHRAS
jgi:hypothetical protein